MYYQKVCLEVLSYVLPEYQVTSLDIEQRLAPIYEKLNLPFGRLELMSGIRERRFWAKGLKPSEASARAGEKAIEAAGLDREKLGCLLHTSVSRDFLEPATATAIHRTLRLPPSALVFDVSNACLGFVNGMMIVANMIELGQIQAGLIVSGEHAGPLVETTIEHLLKDPAPSREKLKQSFASLTIGSGAAAVILTHQNISKTGHRLLGGAGRIDSHAHDLCQGSSLQQDHSVHWDKQAMIMQTASERLLQAGCLLAQQTWMDTKIELGWQNDKVDRFFSHQVGSAHRRALFQHLELDLAKDYPTFEFLGNMGSASLPVTMSLGVENRQLLGGQKAALLGIGSGINCSMLGVEW